MKTALALILSCSILYGASSAKADDTNASVSANTAKADTQKSWFIDINGGMRFPVPQDVRTEFHIGSSTCVVLPEQTDHSREILCTTADDKVVSGLAMCNSGYTDRSSTMIVDGRTVSIACEGR